MHAHFDCFSGISGDMVLGACVDLGVSAVWLREQILELGIGDVDIVSRDVKRNGIGAKQVSIVDKTTSHPRNYADIVELIEKSRLSKPVKLNALAIFDRIADAESIIHQCDKQKVHFHEVGAVDSIADIVGTALCIDQLNIATVSASPLPLGSGFVDCAHGKLPVPAPAVVEILKGKPVYGGPSDGELVTPTGAGIVVSLAREFGVMPDMTIIRVGYGSGTRDRPGIPNLLRIYLGEPEHGPSEAHSDEVMLLETNIDDMNPEIYGYLMERMFEEGALDVSFIPVFTKKNRPATKIEVLCPIEKKGGVIDRLFMETSTLGVRFQRMQRKILERSSVTLRTRFGDVQVKCITDGSGRKRYLPEYEACRRVALDTDQPLQRIYDAVATAASDPDNLH